MSKFTVGKLREFLVAFPPQCNLEICKSTLYVDDGEKIVAMIDFTSGVHRKDNREKDLDKDESRIKE